VPILGKIIVEQSLNREIYCYYQWSFMTNVFKRERTYLSIHRSILFISLCLTFISHGSIAQSVKVKVFDNNNNALENVVVYLEPPKGIPVTVSNKVIVITQIDKSFSPYIGVMQKGAIVKFHNNDNITHQIYSPIGDNKFAFKISAGQELMKNDFMSAGTVAMGCNIHDWMSGYLLILETPYFAKTDSNGQVIIEVAQAGFYNVVVWHPQMREEDQRISKVLSVGKVSTAEMRLLQPLAELPSQKDDEDFDFLSDY
jgi:plastocyanin